MRLYDYYVLNQGKSIFKNAHYFPIYERYFSRFVGHELLLIEIGTGQGGSARMWKYYFGPLARIVTIDIKKNKHAAGQAQIFPRCGNQADTAFLKSVTDEFGPPDIVMDDGSHLSSDIKASFSSLFPITKAVYLIEDIGERGSTRNPAWHLDAAKNLIAEVGIDHTKQITSVGCYPRVVVFEKSRFMNTQFLRLPEAPGEVDEEIDAAST